MMLLLFATFLGSTFAEPSNNKPEQPDAVSAKCKGSAKLKTFEQLENVAGSSDFKNSASDEECKGGIPEDKSCMIDDKVSPDCPTWQEKRMGINKFVKCIDGELKIQSYETETWVQFDERKHAPFCGPKECDPSTAAGSKSHCGDGRCMNQKQDAECGQQDFNCTCSAPAAVWSVSRYFWLTIAATTGVIGFMAGKLFVQTEKDEDEEEDAEEMRRKTSKKYRRRNN